MTYQRKTTDEWRLWADYGHGHGWELETTEPTLRLIMTRLREYRENAPSYSYKRTGPHRVPMG